MCQTTICLQIAIAVATSGVQSGVEYWGLSEYLFVATVGGSRTQAGPLSHAA